MEREALAALEKRVTELRIVAAEKAVLARSMADAEPPRFHAEISTALLALAVFVVFLAGREAGIFAAHGAPCRSLPSGEYAWVKMYEHGGDITIDTKGNLWRKGRWERHVRPSAVRAIANRLVEGCFLEQRPLEVRDDVAWTTIELSTSTRYGHYTHPQGKPPKLCGGDVDLGTIEKWIHDVDIDAID